MKTLLPQVHASLKIIVSKCFWEFYFTLYMKAKCPGGVCLVCSGGGMSQECLGECPDPSSNPKFQLNY